MNRKNMLIATQVLAGLLASGVTAETLTWNVAGSGNWDASTANWTNSAGASVAFADGGVDHVIFNNTAGGTITISANMSPLSTTVSAASGTYTFSGGPIDSGSLTKNGGGTLWIANAQTYGGGTFINGGVVQCQPSGSQRLGSGPIEIHGATLFWNAGGLSFTNAFLIDGSSTVSSGDNEGHFNGPVTLNGTLTTWAWVGQNFNGNVTGSGGFINSSGHLKLAGTNTFTGTLVINKTLVPAKPESLYNANTANWTPANITIASGATLYFSLGSTGWNDSGVIGTLLSNLATGINNNGLKAGSAVAFDTTSGDFTLSTAITDSTGTGGGALKVYKYGTKTLTLSGASTYTGATYVQGGNPSTLKAGVASVPGVSGPFGNDSALVVSDWNQVDLNGFDVRIGSLTGGGSSANFYLGSKTLTIGGDNTSPAAYAGIIQGSGGKLTKIGTGTLTLSVANTYSGTTTISAGTLRLGTGTSGQDGSVASTSIVDNAILVFNNFSAQTYSGNISGTGTLIKNGAGTLTLSGTNSYSGGTTITNGTLALSGTGTLGSGDVTVSGNAYLSLAAAGNIALSDTGRLTITAGTVTLAAGVNETVNELYINGKQQNRGTWGSSASLARNVNNERFAGTGMLTVLNGPSSGTLVSFF